ncbi:Ig-like domain-containing protein [Paenimyroides baculatum]|uniref:T9SS type A sorting domain-containing protein n=1 Tax=Paenimyroides baculatum TaxID=2608000 RepID=A0A5M6C9J2_9FLAO|nr:T9SS type A sorting domain-containing protein [Paenimyroides baculatum]KAA5531764.1 T9SS type A sorting domain-containing protein [Paenimyroides baculatum]
MKKYLIIFILFLPLINWGQITTYTNDWEGVTTVGWTQIVGTYNVTTVSPCGGTNSIRTRLQGNGALGTSTLRGPSLGTTNGGLITFTYDYKWLRNNGNIAGNPQGAQANSLDLRWQWSSTQSGPWYTFDTVDVTNHTVSTSCTTRSVTFTAYANKPLFVRIVTTNKTATGDNYLYLDNVNVSEGAAPSCKMPTDIRISNKTATTLDVNWLAPAGQTATGYEWEVRSSGAPGSGTTGLADGDIALGTANFGTANTLTPETIYKIYVRAICSPTEASPWIGIEDITMCNAFTMVTNDRNVCGIQEVELNVTGAGTKFWFDEDDILVAQGVNTFTTPEITESTKYTVFSGTNTTSTTDAELVIGTGVATNGVAVPFTANKANKIQYIYQASELKAAGFNKGVIRSFGFRAGASAGTLQRNNFAIHMGLTPLEEFGDTNFIPTAQLQMVKNAGNQLLVSDAENWFKLDTPFIWDGYSNIVVQFTYSDVAGSGFSTTNAVSTTFASVNSNRTLYTSSASNNILQMYNIGTGTTNAIRMNGYFKIIDGCFGEMRTINLTFKDAPLLNLSSDIVNNCAGNPLTKLYVLTGVSDYNTYTWTTIDPNDTNDPVNDPLHPNNPANAIVGDQYVGWTFNTTTNMTYVLNASNTTGEMCVIKKTITVENNPSPQMLQLLNDYKLCTNDIQELKVDNFVNETPYRYLFNGNTTGVTLSGGVAGDAIANETTLFSEGTGSLKMTYAAQTNATLNYAASINMFNLKSIVVEFDHIAALQATTPAVMDYGYLEYTTDNGTTWKPFLVADYTGLANSNLPKPTGNPSIQAMFFSKTSYADWSGIQQTTPPANNSAWKSEKFIVPAADFTGSGTFKVRFRIGADGNTQFPGWYIDNVKITPISNYQISWTPIANLYYDQAATVPYDATINSGTLYLKGTTNSLNVPYKIEVTNQYGCKAEKNFTVSVGLKEAPTVTNLDKCGSIDVSTTNFGKNPNGTLIYYASQTSSTPITQITTSGVYYVEQEISGCKSARIPFTVIINPIAPVPVASPSQTFCGSATVNNLSYNVVAGFQIQWYLTATTGTPLASNAPINNGTYYGEFTNGVCTSASRVVVNVSVGVTPAAISLANVYICGTSTISDISVSSTPGAIVNWYQNINDVTPLSSTTVLTTGTYYIAQKMNNCESSRTAVTVSTVQNLTMPTAATVQTFCGSATVGSLMASATTTGANVYWYNFSTSDTPLANTTPLTTGTYYVGQSIGDCDSPRKTVSVKILSVNAPVINPLNVCGDATVSSLPLNPVAGTSYKVYNSAFATTDMGQNDVVNTGTYYISVVENGCETARAAVYITVNARPNSPTGNSNQTIVDYGEVKNLKANETNVIWFASYNDAVNNVNPLPIYTPLQDGKTYYGVLIGTGNCASLPMAVTVKIALGLNDLDLASLKYYPNPVDSELTVSYKEAIKLIEVYDILGKQIKTQKFDANDVRLDVSTLSAGTYMVKVHTNAGSQFIKIIKK